MFINFEKWHGCLNDFIVMWISDADGDIVIDSIKRQARHLCDRRAGIGADGILVLQTLRSQDLTPYGLTIINSDGSLAKTCGNGLRCAALSILKTHLEKGDAKQPPELVQLCVADEDIICRFAKKSGEWPMVIVEMGTPNLNKSLGWLSEAKAAVAKLSTLLNLPSLSQEVGVCDIGNPHIVITHDLASRELLLKIGPTLQSTHSWDGINVHLARAKNITAKDKTRATQELGQSVSELYEVFVWERGAGETMACGSGACAVAALALDSGLLDRSEWVAIDMPGGRLYVRQPTPDEPTELAGPGVYCFSGKVII